MGCDRIGGRVGGRVCERLCERAMISFVRNKVECNSCGGKLVKISLTLDG